MNGYTWARERPPEQSPVQLAGPATACTANCGSRYSACRTLSTVPMGVRASATRYMTTAFMRKLVRFEIMDGSLFDATDQS